MALSNHVDAFRLLLYCRLCSKAALAVGGSNAGTSRHGKASGSTALGGRTAAGVNLSVLRHPVFFLVNGAKLGRSAMDSGSCSGSLWSVVYMGHPILFYDVPPLDLYG